MLRWSLYPVQIISTTCSDYLNIGIETIPFNRWNYSNNAKGLSGCDVDANRDEETWAFESDGEYRIDEYGIGYSLDGHRLLFARYTFKDSDYSVPNGVVTICSMAFATCRQFVTLFVPRSVRLIGDFVFGSGGGKIVIKDEE